MLLVPVSATAQTSSIRGFITDQSNGHPLELATVSIRSSTGEMRGTVTNKDGGYILARVEPGTYQVQVSFLGYITYVDTLQLDAGRTQTLSVALVPDETSLNEVLVQSERTSGSARITAGQQTVRPADIELIPTPDVSGDLASYLTTVPGVVSTGDRGGQLFIRGGEPWQNLVQLDGVLVYQPFHILGFYSAFPSDIINRTDLYAGGYPSRFSGRISSVIDVSTRNGNNRRFAGAASLSPFVSSLRVEGPLIPGKISFLTSVRESVIDRAIAPLLDEEMPFYFGDFFAKVSADVTSKSRFSFTALNTHDRGRIAENTGTRPLEELRWKNKAYSARFLSMPSLLQVMADWHFTYSRLESEQGPQDAPTRLSYIDDYKVSLDATFFGKNHTIEAGWSAEVLKLTNELGGLFQNVYVGKGTPIRLAGYFEPEITIGSGFRIRPGILFQHTEVKPASFEPRIRVVWDLGGHQLSGAAGLYRQEIIGLNDRRDATSVFTAWTIPPARNSPRIQDVRAGLVPEAVHSILGYRASPAGWLDVAFEGYYKWLNNLFIPEWTAFPRYTTRLQPADGKTAGFDARVEIRSRLFDAYINYGLSSTRYEAKQASLLLWYGEESLSFRPPHDRRHQVNLVVSTSWKGFDASLHWEFGSGLPYSQALGFDGFIFMNGLVNVGQPGSRRVIYARPFNALLPTYHRLDLSIERSFEIGPADVTIQGSVINAYDRRNLFYLDVFTLERKDQLPFIPSLGLKIAYD